MLSIASNELGKVSNSPLMVTGISLNSGEGILMLFGVAAYSWKGAVLIISVVGGDVCDIVAVCGVVLEDGMVLPAATLTDENKL